jgi:Kef-type K+ transport system membrane component KefB
MSALSLSGLLIVAGVAFAVPLVLSLTPARRLPASILEIVAGIIIGPSGFGWVRVDAAIQLLSLIGLAFLLFIAGLQINLHRLKGHLLLRVSLSFLLSFGLALFVGSLLSVAGQVQSPLYLAILFSATALGMIVPLLEDAGQVESDLGQLVITSATMAQFGSVILLSLFFSNETAKPGIQLLFLASFLLLAMALAFVLLRLAQSQWLGTALLKLQDTTAQIRVRGAFMLLLAFVAVAARLGIEVLLAAFVGGVILRLIDPDAMKTHPVFHQKLAAIGFGVFVPVFLVTTGLQLDLTALLTSPSTLALVPLFFVTFLLVRGLPALLYKRLVGTRQAIITGLLQATSLSFLVAATQIGMQLRLMTRANGAALIAAGVVGALIFPVCAMLLLRPAEKPVAGASQVHERL